MSGSRFLLWMLVAKAACFILGCGSPAPAQHLIFDQAGVHSTLHSYVIHLDSRAAEELTTAGWKVDNFFRQKLANGKTEWTPRTENPYMQSRVMDGELTLDLPTYDFRLINTVDNGDIWVSTVPQPEALAEKQLDLLLADYIDSLNSHVTTGSSVGFGFVGFGSMAIPGFSLFFQQFHFETKRIAASIKSSTKHCLDGHEAFDAVIEITDLDQKELNDLYRKAYMRVVMTRIWGTVWRQADAGYYLKRTPGPVVLFAAYSNSPAYFDKNMGSFEKVLNAIDLPQLTHQPLPSCTEAVASNPVTFAEMSDADAGVSAVPSSRTQSSPVTP